MDGNLVARIKSVLWGFFYTLLTAGAIFLVQNVDIVGQLINESLADHPRVAAFVFTILTVAVMQLGRWLRDKGLMPLMRPTK